MFKNNKLTISYKRVLLIDFIISLIALPLEIISFSVTVSKITYLSGNVILIVIFSILLFNFLFIYIYFKFSGIWIENNTLRFRLNWNRTPGLSRWFRDKYYLVTKYNIHAWPNLLTLRMKIEDIKSIKRSFLIQDISLGLWLKFEDKYNPNDTFAISMIEYNKRDIAEFLKKIISINPQIEFDSYTKKLLI